MIECIRTYYLEQEMDEPLGFSQWYYKKRSALLVEVIDNSGAVGWGECYGPAQVTQAAIQSFYAPLLIGWDPLCNEAAWQHCWRLSVDFARKGIMMGGISGLDMALLDLKGKLLQVPAAELMGGRVRDKVAYYVTGMYYNGLPERQLLAKILKEAEDYHAQGFKALKIKVGKNITFDKMLIKQMRQELPDTQLMADANHAYDLPEAIQIGRMLDKQDYIWFEEPLSPEHPELFRQLAEKIDIPLATGECEQTRWGFQNLLSRGGVHIAQPDLAYCGGPTEGLKIRTIASAYGVNVIPHVWGTLLNMATATHFLASAHREPGRAEIIEPLLEMDCTPNPLRNDIYAKKLVFEDGKVKVPTDPGLGVEPDRKAMASFCIQKMEVT